MKNDIIIEQIINTEMYLNISELNNDIDNTIFLKLKKEKEGKCYENGFILKDTIEILKRSIGKVSIHNNKSIIHYIISYKAKIISINKGDKLNIYINSMNKMGIIGYIKINKFNLNEFNDSPLFIIIPNEYINSDEDIKLNDKIKIEVLARRIKFDNDKIQIIGKVV